MEKKLIDSIDDKTDAKIISNNNNRQVYSPSILTKDEESRNNERKSPASITFCSPSLPQRLILFYY